MELDLKAIEQCAQQEIQQQKFREAVDQRKIELQRVKWWHRLVPFTISIKWRD